MLNHSDMVKTSNLKKDYRVRSLDLDFMMRLISRKDTEENTLINHPGNCILLKVSLSIKKNRYQAGAW